MEMDKSLNAIEALAQRWLRLTPPARPSEGLMARYEEQLLLEKRQLSGNWCLLGCTPEIRSLAGKYQRPLTCIDQNPDAYPAFRLLCHPSASETFVCSDWLEADLPGYFDVIFGDGSVAMLPVEQHQSLLESIYRMLKPNGLALLRISVSDDMQFKTPQEVFDWYRASCPELPIYKAAKTFLSLIWLDPATGRTQPLLFKERINELYRDGILTKAEFEGFAHAKKSTVEVNYTRKTLFEQACAPYFDITGIRYANDYPSHRHNPLYALRKKETAGILSGLERTFLTR